MINRSYKLLTFNKVSNLSTSISEIRLGLESKMRILGLTAVWLDMFKCQNNVHLNIIWLKYKINKKMLYKIHDKNKAKKVKCVVYGGLESSTRSGLAEHIQTNTIKWENFAFCRVRKTLKTKSSTDDDGDRFLKVMNTSGHDCDTLVVLKVQTTRELKANMRYSVFLVPLFPPEFRFTDI